MEMTFKEIRMRCAHMLLAFCCWLLTASPLMAAQKPLILCVVEHNTPFAFYNRDREMVGFDIDMWEAMRLEQPFTYRGTDLATALAGLANNSCDMALSNISVTPERAARFSFSVPYLHSGLGIMIRTDDTRIRNRADLNGKTIVVPKGSTAEQYIFATNKGGVVLALERERAIYDTLLSGKADAVVWDLPMLQGFVRFAGKERVTVLDDVFAPQTYAYGFAKNRPELRASVNSALQRMTIDGTISQLYEKWFGKMPLPTN